MENRDKDKLNKDIDTSKQKNPDVNFGKNIGKPQDLKNEPSRQSGSQGSQQGSKGSMGSSGSSGSE